MGTRWMAAWGSALAALCLLGLSGLVPAGAEAQARGWTIGSIVGLSKGTQIRVAQGLGACYHTLVPENDWKVKVIGGPRQADEHLWYDTSRKEAGDPSGGTGWVDYDQATQSPAVFEGTGAYCPPGSPEQQQQQRQLDDCDPNADLLAHLRCWWVTMTGWWDHQPLLIQIGVGAVALLLLAGALGRQSWGTYVLRQGIRAALLGLVLWWFLGLTRPIWEPLWASLWHTDHPPDLALIVGLLPLLGWGLRVLRRG